MDAILDYCRNYTMTVTLIDRERVRSEVPCGNLSLGLVLGLREHPVTCFYDGKCVNVGMPMIDIWRGTIQVHLEEY